MRRLCSVVATLWALFVWQSAAANPVVSLSPATPSAPAQEVSPFRSVNPPVLDDARTVRLYFSYTCPFCRTSHKQLTRWGSTLPKQLQFRVSPVVGVSETTMIPAFAFYTVRKLAPGRIDAFNELIYEEVQDRNKPVTDLRMYVRAAQQIGIAPQKFIETWGSEGINRVVTEAVKLGAQYRLTSTPSLAIGGTMVITPEVTNGVNDAFINLANATTSKAMIEMGLGGMD